jgi:thiol-disulfide isomerase/thioredoxin
MDRACENHAAEPASRPGGEKAFTLFLVLACLVLAVLVVLLARENRSLKAELVAASREAPAEALQPGDRLGSLTLVNEEGATKALDFDGGGDRTLLLVFSPDCPACEATFPVWEFLVEGTPPALRVVGLSVGEEPPPSLAFPVFTLPDAERESLRRVPLVPATLLVDGSGQVVRAWYGMLETEDEDALLFEVAAADQLPE